MVKNFIKKRKKKTHIYVQLVQKTITLSKRVNIKHPINLPKLSVNVTSGPKGLNRTLCSAAAWAESAKNRCRFNANSSRPIQVVRGEHHPLHCTA